ncbi:histidine kinase [Hoyosella sp. YIM 151337]|uniref:sensor histidine kinase n=1 Tax=Hoyosella sp. YIM 151337 TaxID=2992742 RepID=UPI00243480E7
MWLREKPKFADGLLAGLFVLFELLTAPATESPVLFLVMGTLMCLPVIWRRAYPVLSSFAILAASFASTVVLALYEGSNVGHPSGLLLVVALYTLVMHVNRKVAGLFVAGLVVDTALKVDLLGYEMPASAFFLFLFYFIAWLAAEVVAVRHRYNEEIAARLRIAESEQDRRAQDAVAAERTRIARELHDVVAHAVSVMIVQAEGATFAIKKNPELAERAMNTVASTGRQALAELRRTLALLRTDQAPDELPEYGTAGLARTAQLMRDAGLPVELELTGDLDSLGPAVGLGIQRLVQESLTNVLRHAGEGARARVRVRRTDGAVDVTITDFGGHSELRPALAAGPAGAGVSMSAVGSGKGLVGMRERVAVLGGTLETGPTPGDGWRVHAQLPVD